MLVTDSGFCGSTKLGNLNHVFYHVVFKSHVITFAFDRTLFTHHYPITSFLMFHVVRFFSLLHQSILFPLVSLVAGCRSSPAGRATFRLLMVSI
jgi:hypothetical protein